MKTIALTALISTGLLSASTADAASAVSRRVAIAGVVSPLCSIGNPADGDTVFNLGTLIDTATGLLLPNLAASKTLNDAFCNTLSEVRIAASPMRGLAATAPAPAGFSSTVDFRVAASGWSAAPAVFATGLTDNPGAGQSIPGAFAATIVLDLTQFAASGGPTSALVADPQYQGTVTITVAVAS